MTLNICAIAMTLMTSFYKGRFAPSPSGDLHFGSLVTAMASYAQAKSKLGQWIVRIDDIDTPRIFKGSDKSILTSLEQLGFNWDGDTLYQSNNIETYESALKILNNKNLTYPCYCTRKQIIATTSSGIYTGQCENASFREFQKKRNQSKINQPSVRIKTNDDKILFEDLIQKKQKYCLSNLSEDFILKRSDNIFSYLFTFVVDCFNDNVTEIIRANDLINSTANQIYLQKLLGYPIPTYAHIPIICNKEGNKLGKSTGAPKVLETIESLLSAANVLGQLIDKSIVDATIDEFWIHFIDVWDVNLIPKKQYISIQ